MNWFILSLLPPAIWAMTNHLDKYLISKFFRGGGVGALMVFSSIVGVFLLPIIVIWHPEVLGFSSKSLFIVLNGFIYLLATLPYFYALQKDEASICVALFQLIPLFSFVIAYFVLGERLSVSQIISGAIIIFGAIIISLDLSGKKLRFKKEVFWLMMLSSFLYALNFLLFKYFALDSSFWFTSFWEYAGFAIFSTLLMIFIPVYRREFIEVFKSNRTVVLGMNGLNEILNIIAKISFNVISIFIPVTLVWIVNGLQPLFVFIYGVILTIVFPRFSEENLSKRSLIQKIFAIILLFIGVYLINKG